MKVVSVKVDEGTKARMEELDDINWSEVIRRSIRERIALEDSLRKPLDRRKALRASASMDALRGRTSGRWGGVAEIRKWRDLRR